MALSPLDGWLIAAVLIVAYSGFVVWLYRTGRLGPDRTFSLFGPALMVKTQRGRGWLDRIGRFSRFWSVVGAFGVALAAAAMGVVVFVLALDAIVATQIPASSAPSPAEALGIPGLNPIIPLGYGLVAIVVGIVFHELAHGVLARSQKIGVKSIGILWLVVPIGAFVEQDDTEMTQAPRRQRRRVAAAGVLANFALAVLFFALLSGIVAATVQPNADGVGIGYVVPNSPAANATLAVGDIITAINGTPTATNTALLDQLSSLPPNTTVNVTYYSASRAATLTVPIVLADRASYTGDSSQSHEGFLGVAPLFLTPAALKGVLVSPLQSSNGPLLGTTDWIVLPLAGLEPIQGPTAGFFHLSGPLAAMGDGSFWILANLLFWLAWMNLLLGLSNALPLIPLDGGLLFRDFVAGIASRVRPAWDADRLNRFSGSATAAASVAVVLLLVWQFVGPRL
ncbi:MAG TPA: site-2 protease family protein [Thermoplasmata archaeon]|nr:site-2 protease family protein [Thermoplasmata archaeon]